MRQKNTCIGLCKTSWIFKYLHTNNTALWVLPSKRSHAEAEVSSSHNGCAVSERTSFCLLRSVGCWGPEAAVGSQSDPVPRKPIGVGQRPGRIPQPQSDRVRVGAHAQQLCSRSVKLGFCFFCTARGRRQYCAHSKWPFWAHFDYLYEESKMSAIKSSRRATTYCHDSFLSVCPQTTHTAFQEKS